MVPGIYFILPGTEKRENTTATCFKHNRTVSSVHQTSGSDPGKFGADPTPSPPPTNKFGERSHANMATIKICSLFLGKRSVLQLQHFNL